MNRSHLFSAPEDAPVMDRIPSALQLKMIAPSTSIRRNERRVIGAMLLWITAFVGFAPAVWSQSSDDATSELTLEPYVVFVANDDAYARCGPADDYYRTDPLRPGQELEVYAETEDGWLGIRPPEDSFCWIPADAVQLDDDDEQAGTITEDRTVAWIGTQLGRARHYRWQVQLAEGEPIVIVGRSEREGPDGPQLWLRIVPPSGEYRWVRRDDVVETSEELVALMKQRATRQEAAGETSSKGDERVASDSRESATANASRTTEDSMRRGASGENRSAREPLSQASRQARSTSDEMIGSGLKASHSPQDDRSAAERLADAVKQSGLLASLEFLGQPRVVEINSQPVAPETVPPAEDGNWVAGTTGRNRAWRDQSAPSERGSGVRLSAPSPTSNSLADKTPDADDWDRSARSGVMQATSLQPTSPSRSFVRPASATSSPQPRTTIVSAERIAQIEAELQDADYEQLSLVFSRLMAAGATGAETEPVERAARSLASSATDVVVAGRARLLAERAAQYRRVANRRDGEAVIRSTQNLSIPPAVSSDAVSDQTPKNVSRTSESVGAYEPSGSPSTPPPSTATETVAPTSSASQQSGYLVQVYSARKNSPPFALTDNTGRTVAYVTPAPGVNLRSHLNSMIEVTGNPGYLTGLNTPHILVTDVARTAQ